MDRHRGAQRPLRAALRISAFAAAALAVAAAFLLGQRAERLAHDDACLDAGGAFGAAGLCAIAAAAPPGLHLGPIRLTRADVTAVERAPGPNGLARVTLVLAPAPAAALAGLTGAMSGRDLILAIDGVRTSGVRIVTPITGGRVTMAMALAQADELEAMVDAGS